jgi:hypothetical protein
LKKCGIIYHIECGDCPLSYVGETSRSFETRLKEHKKTKGTLTAVGEHLHDFGHHLANDNNKIIAREDSYWPRKIRESIEIKIRKPDLNRDAGYHITPPPSTTNCCQLIPYRGQLTGRPDTHIAEEGRAMRPKATIAYYTDLQKVKSSLY